MINSVGNYVFEIISFRKEEIKFMKKRKRINVKLWIKMNKKLVFN